jgi:uncharacterized protein with FMN-binding domain
MNIKKYLVSFVFVVLFAGYAALQYLNNSFAAYTTSSTSAPSQQIADNASAAQSATPPQPIPTQTETAPVAQATIPTPTQTTPAPTPTPTPTPQPQGQYVDGTYIGDPENAYYGMVQVQVTVSGGQVADVQFLQYPNTHSTSVYINQQAMPILRQEAIQAQSANINGVSGASDTSAAFQQSLASALSQAKS